MRRRGGALTPLPAGNARRVRVLSCPDRRLNCGTYYIRIETEKQEENN